MPRSHRPGKTQAPFLPIRTGGRLLITGSLLMGQLGFPLLSKAQSPGEICSADTMPLTTTWNCNNPASNTIFWTPCLSGDWTLAMPSATRNVTVASKPGRRLTVDGTTGDDILIGSPESDETLRGSGGLNTYVVGGSSAYTRAVGDKIIVTTTSAERDSARFVSALPDYIHINATAQANPGWLITAKSPTVAVKLRGSSELKAICPSSFFSWLRTPGSADLRLAMGSSDLPCSPCGLPGNRKAADQDLFPGVTTIEGFDLHPRRGDRIVLPAEDYLFMNQSLAGFKEVAVLIVNKARFGSGQLVDAAELKRLQANAPGLTRVSSAEAPLVYFSQNGLLVFSQNDKPLGSEGNPGRVIARLLDGNGKPVALPRLPGQRLAMARFVIFTPAQSQTDPDRLR